MNCVFGSVLNQASVSRQCVGIDQWMSGINPGQCFSEVTLEIQVIGVSVMTFCLYIVEIVCLATYYKVHSKATKYYHMHV